jgi:PTS system fructose-specific IIC component
MVSLAVTLQPERVIELTASDKPGALRELVAAAARAAGEPVDQAALEKAVLEREDLATTGFGEGLAMPHVRFNGVKRFVTVLARSKTGIDFNALDGQPVHLFLLVVGPEPKRDEYLKLMKRASSFLKNEKTRLLGLPDFGKAAADLALEY